jgi:hypothetical protein
MLIPRSLLIAAMLSIGACAPPGPDVPTSPSDAVGFGPPPYEPRAGDASLVRGGVQVDSVDVRLAESFPVQVFVTLRGGLPTPCDQTRALVHPADRQNRIEIEVYSVSEPGQVCAQVIQPFEINVALGSYAAGRYSLWVNAEKRAEFDV